MQKLRCKLFLPTAETLGKSDGVDRLEKEYLLKLRREKIAEFEHLRYLGGSFIESIFSANLFLFLIEMALLKGLQQPCVCFLGVLVA